MTGKVKDLVSGSGSATVSAREPDWESVRETGSAWDLEQATARGSVSGLDSGQERDWAKESGSVPGMESAKGMGWERESGLEKARDSETDLG